MKEGKSFVSSSTYIVNREKRRIPISVSTSLLKNATDQILGGVETFRDSSVVEELRRELSGCVQLGDMVSRSSTMRHIFGILEQVALSGSTMLIEGETGTGKEVLARAIHNLSPRRDRPFVAINCGALPDTLLESELFGYKAGAFTGADRDKPGLFLAAEGGTLLLDEMGDTSPAFQVKLLRVLEERDSSPGERGKGEKQYQGHCRDQPRSVAAGRGGNVPPRSVLPDQYHPPEAAAAPGTSRGYPSAN